VQQGVEILARHRVIAAFGLRKSSASVTEIKTVGELISALKHVATDGAKLNGTWEVEWIADKVRLQKTYEMEAYEWSYT
jgi:hypothetical protein